MSEIRLFCVVQNEALRLPAFLRHYRAMGVNRFFIVDNKSTDHTASLLRAQPDVHLFYTETPFAAARYGIDWMNHLLNRFGVGHWCVVADADELLVYHGSETMRLPQFCAKLEKHGAEAVQAILLDMYSDKPMMAIGYKPGQDLVSACPYFDADYEFVPRYTLPWQGAPFPAVEPLGGPRTRLFFPDQYNAAVWRRLAVKLAFRAMKPLAAHGLVPSYRLPHPAPQLFKLPIIKWRQGRALITNHRMTPVPLAKATGALLHFKYLQDFEARTVAAIAHGQHYGGSIEYCHYGKLLQANPGVTFMYPGSRRYTGSVDLAQAGLIRAM